MSVDRNVFPRATGRAADTVAKHEANEDLVFYNAWFCPFAQRTWLSLELKGIRYQYKEENPYLKDADFLKVSPKGLVPAILYKGRALPESLVICEFLEDGFPNHKPLLPKDAYERAQIRLSIDHMSKAVIPSFYKLMQAQTEEGQDEARAAFAQGLKTWISQSPNDSIGQQGFFVGQEISLADVVMIPWIVRLHLLERFRKFDVNSIPGLENYRQRVLAVDHVQNTISEEDRYAQVYERYLKDESQSEAAKATRSGQSGFF